MSSTEWSEYLRPGDRILCIQDGYTAEYPSGKKVTRGQKLTIRKVSRAPTSFSLNTTYGFKEAGNGRFWFTRYFASWTEGWTASGLSRYFVKEEKPPIAEMDY